MTASMTHCRTGPKHSMCHLCMNETAVPVLWTVQSNCHWPSWLVNLRDQPSQVSLWYLSKVKGNPLYMQIMWLFLVWVNDYDKTYLKKNPLCTLCPLAVLYMSGFFLQMSLWKLVITDKMIWRPFEKATGPLLRVFEISLLWNCFGILVRIIPFIAQCHCNDTFAQLQ